MITAHEQDVVPVHGPPAAVRQSRPEQQPTVVEHAWPSDEQVFVFGWQEPVVEPPVMLQVSPEQQSPLTVQALPCG
jgi:hypothetical protein